MGYSQRNAACLGQSVEAVAFTSADGAAQLRGRDKREHVAELHVALGLRRFGLPD